MIENPKDATRKLLELIYEFSNVAGYKIITQKSFAFLFINTTHNEKSEIKEAISFTVTTKRIKYPGINLPKETNLDSILKSRDITLPTKVHLVKVMVFPVVMYGCKSWTVRKAERQKIDAFELWCWRRLLRFPWTVGGSNQSILKEISPGCSLEGLMLKLKLHYFGHLMQRVDSLEKTLMLGGIGGRRRRGRQDEMSGWHH